VLRLEAERLARGWTVFDLARASGVHPSRLSRIRRGGRPTRPELERLSEVLGVEPEDLLKPARLQVEQAEVGT
jgi:transcriptional regulator with XRE-family HTH domain